MKVSQAISTTAPIFVAHGGEGMGKTTLASKFPRVIAILPERGIPRDVTVDEVVGVNSFETNMAALRELHTDPGGYQTLMIDTLDALEAWIIEYTCAKHNWKSIEQPSFGKGWIALDDEWRRYLRAVTAIRNKHSMMVMQTCHSVIERVDDPRAPSYTSYQLRLHRRARGLVMDAADAVFFLANDIRTISDGAGFQERTRASQADGRFIFTEARPAFAAKNRFGMPAKIPLPIDLDFAQLARYWRQ